MLLESCGKESHVDKQNSSCPLSHPEILLEQPHEYPWQWPCSQFLGAGGKITLLDVAVAFSSGYSCGGAMGQAFLCCPFSSALLTPLIA